MLKDKIFADIPTSDTEKVIVSITTFYQKFQKLDIRKYYLDESTGKYFPTKHGVTLSLEDEQVDKFFNGIKEAWEYIENDGTEKTNNSE